MYLSYRRVFNKYTSTRKYNTFRTVDWRQYSLLDALLIQKGANLNAVSKVLYVVSCIHIGSLFNQQSELLLTVLAPFSVL